MIASGSLRSDRQWNAGIEQRSILAVLIFVVARIVRTCFHKIAGITERESFTAIQTILTIIWKPGLKKLAKILPRVCQKYMQLRCLRQITKKKVIQVIISRRIYLIIHLLKLFCGC